MRPIALALAVASALLAACGDGLDPTPSPTPLPVVPEPAAVTTRPSLPACGTEAATGPNGPWNVEARTCLWEAQLAGTPAEFVSVRPTVEGDPITTYYRVLGPGSVEVFEDTTRDQFGERAWKRYQCTALSPLPASTVQPDFHAGRMCTRTALDAVPPEGGAAAPS